MQNEKANGITEVLEKFNREFPRPGINPLKLTDPLDIVENPRAEWPSNESPGIYILMDADKGVLYVGKASCGNIIGGRLNQHFNAYWKPKDDKAQGCRFVSTIALPSGHGFEAPAIEEFLIAQLNPPRNLHCQQEGQPLKSP